MGRSALIFRSLRTDSILCKPQAGLTEEVGIQHAEREAGIVHIFHPDLPRSRKCAPVGTADRAVSVHTESRNPLVYGTFEDGGSQRIPIHLQAAQHSPEIGQCLIQPVKCPRLFDLFYCSALAGCIDYHGEPRTAATVQMKRNC